jgi:hypothetical protein
VGQSNFEWVLDHSAKWLIERVQKDVDPIADYHWATFLAGGEKPAKRPAARPRKPAAPRAAAPRAGREA